MGLSKHLTINFHHSLSAVKNEEGGGVIFSNADDSESVIIARHEQKQPFAPLYPELQ